jgi:hypothetical protein
MNDAYRDLKERLRRLDAILEAQGLSNVDLAQALSRVRRAERHGDRSREPSTELRTLLERAEAMVRSRG